AEEEPARLRPRIGIDSQCIIAFPGDVQAARKTHHAAGAVHLALLPTRFVLRRIPRLGHPPSLGIDWQIIDIALRGREHAITPVIGDQCHQISRDVERSGCPAGMRSTTIYDRVSLEENDSEECCIAMIDYHR